MNRTDAEKLFWKTFGKILPKDATVSICTESAWPHQFKDAYGMSPGWWAQAESFLVFVDLQPEANWAHDCLYVYILTQGTVYAVYHNWPPNLEHGGVPLERPSE